jgi:hypothetical protein
VKAIHPILKLIQTKKASDIYSMRYKHSSIHEDPIQGWQVLVELQLVSGMAFNDTVMKWLVFMLRSVELREDFVHKVINCAKEAFSRVMQNETMVKVEHIHLLVLIPENDELNNQNWGFFRIEKIGITSNQTLPGHTIEFYLYHEG